MLKKKCLFFICLFALLGSGTIFGQIKKPKTISKNDNKIALHFGFREFEGEADAKYKNFGQRLTPWYSFSYSKQLLRAAGVRVSLGGFFMKGYVREDAAKLFYASDGVGFVTGIPYDADCNLGNGWYKQDIAYIDAGLFWWVSLRDFFSPGSTSKFNVRPEFGFAYTHVIEYKGMISGNFLVPTFNAIFAYELNKKFELQLGLNAALTPNGFNGEVSELRYNGYWGFNLGIAHTF
ncbi:MAG: hypothetical protein Q4F97_05480 [Bacteroidales bacterium]|nr:hypothetical protein [Bacteroidales bacterium]